MRDIIADLRFGARLLAKSPVFAATAALLLAVGISANTLIFSVVNALLLRPLPVPHPANLVRLVEVHPNNFVTWSLPYNFCDAAASDTDFSEVICQGEADVAFTNGNTAERVRVHLVSPNFFSSLGASARLGRVLTAEDERTRAMHAVISYGFWRGRMQGDASVLGRRITLGGQPFTVVGVSPEGFNGLAVDTSPDIRVPAAVDRLLVKPEGDMSPAARPLFAQIFGRLRSGVSFARANAELDPRLSAAYQEEVEKIFPPARGESPAKGPLESRLRLESIANGVSTLRAQFSRGLEVLMAGVALLLLMACANVAGLLLARSAARAPEMGIRLALGASAGRIVRQLLTEGLLLALLGGAGGILLTLGCLPLLARGLPPIRDRGAVLQPLALHIDIDFHVLGFAAAVILLTCVLFALSPALRCARTDVIGAVRSQRAATRRMPARNLMVAAQVALCTMILMGAVLLAGTLERLRTLNPGFDRDHVVTLTIDPSLSGYTPAEPHPESAAIGEGASVAGSHRRQHGLARGDARHRRESYFGRRRIPDGTVRLSEQQLERGDAGLLRNDGNALGWRPRLQLVRPKQGPTAAGVVVNQAFGVRFFPGQDPRATASDSPDPAVSPARDHEIVGAVSDAKYRCPCANRFRLRSTARWWMDSIPVSFCMCAQRSGRKPCWRPYAKHCMLSTRLCP